MQQNTALPTTALTTTVVLKFTVTHQVDFRYDVVPQTVLIDPEQDVNT